MWRHSLSAVRAAAYCSEVSKRLLILIWRQSYCAIMQWEVSALALLMSDLLRFYSCGPALLHYCSVATTEPLLFNLHCGVRAAALLQCSLKAASIIYYNVLCSGEVALLKCAIAAALLLCGVRAALLFQFSQNCLLYCLGLEQTIHVIKSQIHLVRQSF